MRGLFPIGSVVPWAKSLSNVPTLANQKRTEWTELNGASISDVESPINGQTLPDLNGSSTDDDQFYLKGADTSGTSGNLSRITAGNPCCGCLCDHASCHCICCGYNYADTNGGGSYGYLFTCFSGLCMCRGSTTPDPKAYRSVYIVRFK